MRPVRPNRIQSAINITPLVDVVLVLLIIFMVMAPQMRKGPEVDLPDTAKPTDQGDERGRILVTIDASGGLWVDDVPVPLERLGEGVRMAADAVEEPRIVIRGDARLHVREVRQAMLAIEDAGFEGVGLIAERSGANKPKGD